jgi:predicted kinase/predicted nucleotidyltransferase
VAADAAHAFAQTVANACANALGEAIAGVILHGSMATSDYVPGQSDIDLLVIVNDPLTDGQIASLRDAIERVKGDAPAPMDLRVVTRHVALAPTKALFMEAYFRIKAGHSALLTETRHAEPDLAVELSVSRAIGQALLGPGPRELIAEVPKRLVLEVDDQQLAHWQELGRDLEHAVIEVLTACRIWQFTEEGRHTSKTEAGRWVLARAPGLEVVEHALHRRQMTTTLPIDLDQVQHLLALVRHRVNDELFLGTDPEHPGDVPSRLNHLGGRLIIVTGAPATGKTTLAAALGSHLGMPVLSKDLIKETLLESVESGSLQESQRLGHAAFKVLYAVAQELLDAGVSVILEAPFKRGVGEPELRSLVKGRIAAVIVCTASPELVVNRFRERATGSERHPGHMDRVRPEISSVLPFEPPDLGVPEIVVDTSRGYQPSLEELIARLCR